MVIKSDGIDMIFQGRTVAEACDIGALKLLRTKFQNEYAEFLMAHQGIGHDCDKSNLMMLISGWKT